MDDPTSFLLGIQASTSPEMQKAYYAAAAVAVIGLSYMWYRKMHKKSGFQPDEYGWPRVDVDGGMADTYPYGNYAGYDTMGYPQR